MTKQFCIHGHDTYLVGRDSTGSCETCSTIRETKWAKPPKGKLCEKRRNAQVPHIALQRKCQGIRVKRLYKIVNGLKNKPCKDCQGWFEPYQMDFDHISDNKACNVSQMVAMGYSLEKILVEIAKCELVCANCHRKRTSLRANPI